MNTTPCWFTTNRLSSPGSMRSFPSNPQPLTGSLLLLQTALPSTARIRATCRRTELLLPSCSLPGLSSAVRSRMQQCRQANLSCSSRSRVSATSSARMCPTSCSSLPTSPPTSITISPASAFLLLEMQVASIAPALIRKPILLNWLLMRCSNADPVASLSVG
jgi:hypothetical protein